MNPKKIIRSKTIWANLAIVLVGVLGYLQGNEIILENPTIVSALAVAVGLGNVLLRFVTSEPIK